MDDGIWLFVLVAALVFLCIVAWMYIIRKCSQQSPVEMLRTMSRRACDSMRYRVLNNPSPIHVCPHLFESRHSAENSADSNPDPIPSATLPSTFPIHTDATPSYCGTPVMPLPAPPFTSVLMEIPEETGYEHTAGCRLSGCEIEGGCMVDENAGFLYPPTYDETDKKMP